MARLKTGILKADGDWPGYFFRGDDLQDIILALKAAEQTASAPVAEMLRAYREAMSKASIYHPEHATQRVQVVDL